MWTPEKTNAHRATYSRKNFSAHPMAVVLMSSSSEASDVTKGKGPATFGTKNRKKSKSRKPLADVSNMSASLEIEASKVKQKTLSKKQLKKLEEERERQIRIKEEIKRLQLDELDDFSLEEEFESETKTEQPSVTSPVSVKPMSPPSILDASLSRFSELTIKAQEMMGLETPKSLLSFGGGDVSVIKDDAVQTPKFFGAADSSTDESASSSTQFTDSDSSQIPESEVTVFGVVENDVEVSEKTFNQSWKKMLNILPLGQFLDEGGFKAVYKLWNTASERFEAVSVMDVVTLEENGYSTMASVETDVSNKMSELVSRRICPHFVQVFETFELPCPPPASRWGSSANPRPHGSVTPEVVDSKTLRMLKYPGQKGKYMYIRMEFCDGGDLEGYLRNAEESVSPIEAASLLFQGALALHTSQRHHKLRHYDVKLLNFFVQFTRKPDYLHYRLGDQDFALPTSIAASEKGAVIKLADFGTSDIKEDTLGSNVTKDCLATVENTPVDIFFMGSEAKQGFEIDAFCLGLGYLHLFLGVPYEEIVTSLSCPSELRELLRDVWFDDTLEQYAPLRQHMEEEDELNDPYYDTFYRMICLLDLSPEAENVPQAVKSSPVWKCFAQFVDEHSATFERDVSMYSLARGTQAEIAEARKGISALDNGLGLLLDLLSVDSSKRPNMSEVLTSDTLSCLRASDKQSTRDFIVVDL